MCREAFSKLVAQSGVSWREKIKQEGRRIVDDSHVRQDQPLRSKSCLLGKTNNGFSEILATLDHADDSMGRWVESIAGWVARENEEYGVHLIDTLLQY